MLLCLLYWISGFLLQCDHYRRGIISGSSCKALCDQRTLKLQHCMSTSSTHQAKPCVPSRFRRILTCAVIFFFFFFFWSSRRCRCTAESGRTGLL